MLRQDNAPTTPMAIILSCYGRLSLSFTTLIFTPNTPCGKVFAMSDAIERLNILSGSPLEPLRGYARAVRIGDGLWISGTTSMTAKGEVIASGDPYEQTRYILSRIKALVVAAGFRMEDIVRTRLYVTNIARWDDYARAHREAFENIRPTSSMVQVVKLVDPRLMIEMEVDAVKGASSIEVLQLASD